MTTALLKKEVVLAIICLFIGAGFIPNVIGIEQALGNTIYVDDDADPTWYDATHVKTIQEGVNNASAGDTVFVYSGTYYEKVVIDRSIELIGEDKTSTIIDCNDIDDAVHIFADWVYLTGFSITGCDNYKWNGIFISEVENITISENIISSEFDHVILIRESSDCTIINNIIKDNPSKAITIEDSSKFEVSSNSISDVRIGVWCYWSRDFIIKENIISSKGKDYSFGIAVGGDPHYLSNSEVNHNTVEGFEFGIELYGASGYVITNNDVKNNVYGILLQFSNENNISGNNILNNENGIYLLAYDNRLYHNNFIGNSAHDEGQNIWDNGKKGNYWDDYKEKYPNAQRIWLKGIWDTPYEIPAGDNQDRYPLIKPYSKSKPYINPLFPQFLEQHPHLFPILRQLLSCIIYEEE